MRMAGVTGGLATHSSPVVFYLDWCVCVSECVKDKGGLSCEVFPLSETGPCFEKERKRGRLPAMKTFEEDDFTHQT